MKIKDLDELKDILVDRIHYNTSDHLGLHGRMLVD